MKLEDFYIDLSKCSEEQRNHIAKILSDNNQPCYQGLLNCLNNGDYNKTFYLLSFFKRRDLWDFAHEGLESTENKTELTYPEFIKLFEGGEGEKNTYSFSYLSCGKTLTVHIEAKNFNKAMIEFATNYHDIEWLYHAKIL